MASIFFGCLYYLIKAVLIADVPIIISYICHHLSIPQAIWQIFFSITMIS